MFSMSILEKSASSASKPAFEHGECYPAMIAGIWTARGSWQSDAFDGIALLFLVKDDNGNVVPRASKFIKFYGGYNVFNGKTAYAQLMCGLLGKVCEGEVLKKAVIDAGFADLGALVGTPCTVRMGVKTSGYAVISDVLGATPRRPGLTKEELPATLEVDLARVFGKFIEIPDTSDGKWLDLIKIAAKDRINASDVPF